MTDTLMEKIREFAMLGAAYAGTARLTSWSESPKGMGFSLRIDDKNEDGEPIVHTHPFRGFPIGKEGQRVAIVAILLGDDPVAANGAGEAPPRRGMPEGNDGKPGQQPESKSWRELSYSQRAGIRCSDEKYQLFLTKEYVLTYRAVLAKKPNASNAEIAADILRTECEVNSRSEILPGTYAANVFDHIERQYDLWLRHEYPALNSSPDELLAQSQGLETQVEDRF
jgi:hypothetical protein